MSPILTISVYRNTVHIGCDTDGCAYTPEQEGQAALVEFFEGGCIFAPEQVGHSLKTPEVAFRFANAMENFERAGIEIMLFGYRFADAQQRDRAAKHIRRCAEVAESGTWE